jgi:hypothetical protein
MKKLGLAVAVVAVCLAVGPSSFAGATFYDQVVVTNYSGGGGYGEGSVFNARWSSDGTEYIQCETAASSSGIFAECVARDSGGHSISCYSSNANIFAAANAVNSISDIFFTVNSDGTCNYLSVDQSSGYL